MRINAVKEGYYEIMERTPDGDVSIDSKASEVEAIQGLINYKLEGKEVFMIPPAYRVDIESGFVKEEIFYGEGYVHMTAKDGTQYIRLRPSMDIIRVWGEQKARPGQGKFILRRTEQSDGIDQYEIYGKQPFEIENDHEVVDYSTGRLRCWATEPWRVEYYVNDVLDPASDPADLPASEYNASITEEEMYRHTRTLTATHGDKVEIIAYNAEGESDNMVVRIETVHTLDQSERIKELNAQIVAIMQEPEPEV